jgi:hypothetical protein
MKSGLVALLLICLAVLATGWSGLQPDQPPPATTVPGQPEISPEPEKVAPRSESLGDPVGFEPTGEYPVGDRIHFSGYTNLAPGNELLVEVRSVSFSPTRKNEDNRWSGISTVVVVSKGATGRVNTWSCLIDTTGFVPDRYEVEISGITVPLFRKSATFTLLA